MAEKKRTVDARGQVDLSAHDEKALRGELGYLARKAAEARRDAKICRRCGGVIPVGTSCCYEPQDVQ